VNSSPSTFEIHASRLDSYREAIAAGLGHDEVIKIIRELDHAVAAVDGRGFAPTPAGVESGLATAIGIESEMWVKDETGNVSGSHKGRHLFGVALKLAIDERLGEAADGRFAIASCGNAALAASVVARAVDHPIDVFVPTWADVGITDRIESLGGTVIRVERQAGVPGDPTHHAMVDAIADGDVAFSCQGTDTPSTIDGGRTLGWELVDTLIEHDGGSPSRLDRLVVQVGGGALASSTVLALSADIGEGRLEAMPVIHAVQPVGNHPFVRAWDLVVARMLDAESDSVSGDRRAAATTLGRVAGASVRAVLAKVTADESAYMWPWEDEPESYASGILDDITYDWLPILEATLASGGWPVVPTEEQFRRAHSLALTHTTIDASPTGCSGLAGLLALAETGSVPPSGERIVVLLTGAMRPDDPRPEAL